jgi:hypothetical protein
MLWASRVTRGELFFILETHSDLITAPEHTYAFLSRICWSDIVLVFSLTVTDISQRRWVAIDRQKSNTVLSVITSSWFLSGEPQIRLVVPTGQTPSRSTIFHIVDPSFLEMGIERPSGIATNSQNIPEDDVATQAQEPTSSNTALEEALEVYGNAATAEELGYVQKGYV